MDDVHSFHTRSYEKANSDDFEISPMRRTLVLLSVLPSLIVKTLFVLAAEIYYLLEAIFHFFVPKTLKDIRGQLAAVSEKLFPLRIKYVQWHWHLTSRLRAAAMVSDVKFAWNWHAAAVTLHAWMST